jgi:hypothetical protein
LVLFSLALLLISTLVKGNVFTPKTKIISNQNIASNTMIQQSNTSSALPGIIPPGPVFPEMASKPNFGGTTFFTSYYQYDTKDKSLKKLSLDKITGGVNVSDYFHRNDETIFVLDDGTIVSILGDDIQRYKTSPSIQKIRISGNQYVGFSNGKLYLSSDLKNWTENQGTPKDIVDFDVPVGQTNILYIRTPKENIIYDVKANKVLSTESPDPKRFGSNLNSYVKYTQDGIVHNRGSQQNSYQGYLIGDVDNKDNLYIFPVKLDESSMIREMYTADDNVILKIDTFKTPSDKINVANQVITK